MNEGPFERWGPWLGIALGVSLALAGVFVDVLGGTPGLGRSQLAILGAGGLVALAGVACFHPSMRPRLGDIPVPGETSDRRGLVHLAVWFGTLAGLADPALLHLQNDLGFRFLYVNPHMSWMSPVSYCALFLLVMLPLMVVGRGGFAWLASRRAGATVLTFLSAGSLLLLFHPEIHEYATLALATGLAVTVWRVVGARRELSHTFVARTTGPAAGLVVVAVAIQLGWPALSAGLAKRTMPSPPTGSPNVLLIVWDTVRGANVSVNGYVRATTPNLTRRAAGGVVFERAIATAPWSLPTHVSLVTGLYPHEFLAGWTTPLEDAHSTLAEVLASRGFVTGGFFANRGFGGRHTGLNRGFQHWDTDVISPLEVLGASHFGRMFLDPVRRLESKLHNLNQYAQKPGTQVTREFLDWSATVGERPFFAFLNYMDAHAPYDAPSGWEGVFSDEPAPPIPADPGSSVQPDQVGAYVDAYDASIAFLDDQIEAIFREIDRRGALDHTLVIIVSDHGEEFDEKGRVGHGRSVYYSVLHVPLVMWLPDRIPAGLRVPDLVTVRDIPATVLDVIGRAGSGELPGTSLSRFWLSDSTSTPPGSGGLIFAAVTDRTWLDPDREIRRGNLLAAFDGPRHYIRVGSDHEELYDIDGDPWELNDLADETSLQPVLVDLRRRTDSIARVYSTRAADGGR